MKRILATAALLLTALSLTSCGSEAASETIPNGGTQTDIDGPNSVTNVPLTSGLTCDVFDGYKAGGVDCDFAAFTEPTAWKNKTGQVESLKVDHQTLYVTRFADGHLCVVFDGYKAGDITCNYPTR